MATKRLTHVDDKGRARMVDVSDKPETERLAVAGALLKCSAETRDALAAGAGKKGDAFAAARIAGILAAKRTGELIPLCHPLALTDVAVELTAVAEGVGIMAMARTVGRTGVEMEAMVAASVAGLTLYDMGKAMEREMELTDVRLVEKRGGKSGHWLRGARPSGGRRR
jgi:cyclic pyranopterin phosphate synthase